MPAPHSRASQSENERNNAAGIRTLSFSLTLSHSLVKRSTVGLNLELAFKTNGQTNVSLPFYLLIFWGVGENKWINAFSPRALARSEKRIASS